MSRRDAKKRNSCHKEVAAKEEFGSRRGGGITKLWRIRGIHVSKRRREKDFTSQTDDGKSVVDVTKSWGDERPAEKHYWVRECLGNVAIETAVLNSLYENTVDKTTVPRKIP